MLRLESQSLSIRNWDPTIISNVGGMLLVDFGGMILVDFGGMILVDLLRMLSVVESICKLDS